jgi:centromere protein I
MLTFKASTSRIDKQILNNAITIVTNHAESNGLTSEQIGRLVDVLVLPDGLDRGGESRIIALLFPSGKVDEDIALKIIGCLGLGEQRASLRTQVCPIRRFY